MNDNCFKKCAYKSICNLDAEEIAIEFWMRGIKSQDDLANRIEKAILEAKGIN